MRAGTIFSSLGSLFALATLALVALLLAGSTRTSSLVSNTYFLKIDFSGIKSDVIPSLETMASADKDRLLQYKFYTIGLWSYCYWKDNGEIAGCTKPSARFHFSLVDIVYNTLGYMTKVNQPGKLNDDVDRIASMSRIMIGLYLVALVAAVLAFIIGCVSVARYKTSKIIATVLAFLSFVGSMVSSGLAAGLFAFIDAEFDKANMSVGSIMGRHLMTVAWGSVAASFLGFVCFAISICTTQRRSRNAVPEQQPFLGSSVPLQDTTYQKGPIDSEHSSANMYNISPTSSYNHIQHDGQYYDPTSNQHPSYYDPNANHAYH